MTDLHEPLTTLSERGTPRGPAAVMDGARRSVQRYRKRRAAVVGGVAATAVLGSAVGVAAYAGEDESRPDALAQAPPEEPPPGPAPLVTDVRLEGHDGFDRVIVELDVDQLADSPEEPPDAAADRPGPDLPEGSIDLAGCSELALEAGLSSPVATAGLGDGLGTWPTPDGLPEGMGGRRITAETTYVDAIIPLCVEDGMFWYAVDFKAGVPGFNENPSQPDSVSDSCEAANPARLIDNIWDVDAGRWNVGTENGTPPCP